MIFRQAQIDKFLKQPDNKIKCVVIYGNNEGLVSEYVKGFTQTISKDINDPFQVAYLLSADINSDAGVLFSEYGSRSLMGGRRVIIVRDGDNNLTKHITKLFDEVSSDTLVIIYSDSLNKKSSLVKLAEDRADMACVSCYEDRDEDIYNAARNVLIENKVTITNEALQLLCSRLSNDRKSSLSEIDKLITYIGDRKNITNQDILNVVSDTSASSMEDICFYTASGDNDKAQKSYNKLIKENVEPISIVRSLYYHFDKILNCVASMEKGLSLDKAVASIRVVFYREASFKNQVHIWKKDKILDVIDLLYKTERNCKTNDMPSEEIVSYMLMQICSAANRLGK